MYSELEALLRATKIPCAEDAFNNAPKISYKKGKTSVTYESNLEATEYTLKELTRAALRDVGKFVCTKFKEAYYQHFKKHSGNAGRATQFTVIASKNTQYPRVQIGIKHNRSAGFYAYFQEFGTASGNVPRLGLLTKTVQGNVAEIVKIESQYLSGLSEEAEKLAGIIDEKEYEGDADGTN